MFEKTPPPTPTTENNPETRHKSPEQQAQVRETIHAIENQFSHLSWNEELLTRWLKRFYGIEIDISEQDNGTFQISSSEQIDSIPQLPENYGYKGGAARAILETALDLPSTNPRDLDIVYLGSPDEEDPRVSEKLAQQYMPDDYAHGHGVEILEENYFTSRDFTINEVIYDGQNVICTKQCLIDTVRNIIRFADYEKRESFRDDDFYVKPKLMGKAIRLVADAQTKGRERARLAEETENLHDIYIDEFHMALHLDRALEQGNDVAQKYVEELINKVQLPTNITTTSEAYNYLRDSTEFVFRSATTLEMERELDFLKKESEYDEYDTQTYTSVVPFWMKT